MRVIRKYAIAVLLSISGSAHAQMIQGGVEGTICNAQGAPHYCAARTDFTFIPLPSPLPSVGGSSGAGNCISQPGYANEVCRATDINSETGSTGIANKQQFGPCCGGAADYPEWNADSTMFWVSDNGGSTLLYQLNDSVDPPQIHCVQSGPIWSVGTATNCITVNAWLGAGAAPNSGVQWDATNPHVFYAVENSTQMWKFTMPSVTPGTPTATQLFDLAVAPNCGILTGSKIGPLRISTDGQNFMMIFSPNGQDEQYRAVYYNLTQGCRWIDTLTGQVGGNWGPTGSAAFNFTNSVTNSQISSGIATVTLNINPTSLPMFINGAAVPTCTITGATNATPIVLTTSATCNVSTQVIGVTGVTGNTAANGTWVASTGGTSITLLHLDGTNSVGNGAYVSGGTLYDGPLITVSGSTHCPACNLTTAEVTAVSGASQTVSYIDAAADVASGADTGGTLLMDAQLHEVAGSGDGSTMILRPSASPGGSLEAFFWQPATLNVNVQLAPYNGLPEGIGIGHYAFGQTHFFNGNQYTAAATFCHFAPASTTIPGLATQSQLIPNSSDCGTGTIAISSGDEHGSIPSNDFYPFFRSTIGTNSLAWVGEEIASSQTTLGKTWRFCASYQDTFSQSSGQSFTAYDGVGTVSPNGKWFAFASDWGSTLGTDAASKVRGDVFLCRLK